MLCRVSFCVDSVGSFAYHTYMNPYEAQASYCAVHRSFEAHSTRECPITASAESAEEWLHTRDQYHRFQAGIVTPPPVAKAQFPYSTVVTAGTSVILLILGHFIAAILGFAIAYYLMTVEMPEGS